MDPKRSYGMLLAPPADGSMSARLPGRSTVPSLDDHVVKPEVTRDEVIRGRRVVAMPALPPHADRQHKLNYVIGAHVDPGYVGSTELLTRASAGSDFATDVSIRKAGTDPATGARYLEELSFEVVNEQTLRDVTEKAEELTARGVRRVFAVFVKTGKVSFWSPEKGAWQDLDLDATIEDRCLSRPLRVRALLDAAEADDAVARALAEKHNPVIEALRAERFAEGKDAGFAAGKDAGRAEGVLQAKAAAILAVLAARGLAVPGALAARITSCSDAATLDRWIAQSAVAPSAEAALGD
ncbi:MAG: Uma2 family endonuclease [Minicystis sp.]